MKRISFTQFGTFSVAVMLPILVICSVWLAIEGFDEPVSAGILSFVILTFVVCLLIFYKITITVDDTHLTFRMGVGMVKRSFPLSEIQSCKPVRNPAWWGIGIRLTPDGWLYNVSGLSAVEITFNNGKDRIRIGTDKPEEVATAVNERTGTEFVSVETEKQSSKTVWFFILILAVAVVFPAVMIITGTGDTSAEFTADGFSVKGSYPLTVRFSEITVADTTPVLPGIKSRTNGFAAGNTLKGNFRLVDGTKVRLYVKTDKPPFIFIKSENAVLFINFSDTGATKAFFEKVRRGMEQEE